jgi:formylmethanofuran dehydrogenase subunit E
MISEELFQTVRSFHGHMCPGLAIGIRASQIALQEVGPHASDDEIVAVVETDMCGVDAIQFLTGCTFGKGNLIFLDHGKNAFSFYRRADNKGIRIITKPQVTARVPCELEDLQDKLFAGSLSPEEQERFMEIQGIRAKQIMEMALDDLFEVKACQKPIPGQAMLHQSLICEACGESTMESRVRKFGGKTLCIPCFEQLEKRF